MQIDIAVIIFVAGIIFNAGFTFYRIKDAEDEIKRLKKTVKASRGLLYRLINELNTSKQTEFKLRYEEFEDE